MSKTVFTLYKRQWKCTIFEYVWNKWDTLVVLISYGVKGKVVVAMSLHFGGYAICGDIVVNVVLYD